MSWLSMAIPGGLGRDAEVVVGEHTDHARGSPRLLDVDGLDPGVGHRRPDVAEIGRARQVQITDVRRADGQEPRVLPSQDAVAEDAHGA